jgi:hypothetical protein
VKPKSLKRRVKTAVHVHAEYKFLFAFISACTDNLLLKLFFSVLSFPFLLARRHFGCKKRETTQIKVAIEIRGQKNFPFVFQLQATTRKRSELGSRLQGF